MPRQTKTAATTPAHTYARRRENLRVLAADIDRLLKALRANPRDPRYPAQLHEVCLETARMIDLLSSSSPVAGTKAAALAAALEAGRRHLLLETLETRGLDRLDFHTLSVGLIREAMAAAFEAGYAAATTQE